MKTPLLLSLLLLSFSPVLGADKAEIKLLIDKDHLAEAKKTLKVKGDKEAEVEVCFFDTAQTLLNGHKTILRARLEREANAEGKKDADVTVKLRGAKQPPAGFATLEPEADWVGPDTEKDVKPSFEKKQKGVDEALMRQVLDGKLSVEKILKKEQKDFAKACLGTSDKDVPWAELRRYGIIKVWKSKRKVGTVKDVAVEFWRLEMEGKAPLELLEISIKTTPEDPRSVADIATEFYQQADGEGLGAATGMSKTEKVIDYYKPGK